jgi:threonine dehydrogenase-like Zn-dependent dehydrogenase
MASPPDDPPLQPNQVSLKTEMASGKHGTTLAFFDNRNLHGHRFDPGIRLFVETENGAGTSQPRSSQPAGTGTTGVGVVAELGSNVTRWRIGDRVFGFMDVRETNICHEDRLWELGNLDPHLALCVEPAYVAFHCIRESLVRFGDSVAVIGLGALGLLTVRMAIQAGAETVFAVDPLPSRRKWAAQNGADHVIDPLAVDAALEIHRLNGGPGVDVAIELAGKYPALYTAIRYARVGGKVCAAGFYQGEAHDLWLGRGWHQNRLTMIVPHGCGWGHLPRDYPAWDTQRAYDCIVSMMRKGKLTAHGLITPVVTIEEGPEVFRRMEHEPNEVIKFAVRF